MPRAMASNASGAGAGAADTEPSVRPWSATARVKKQTAVDAPIVALFVVSVALKALLIPSYSSTDLEVHRNWLALTHSLPPSRWYHEATSQWTLDYPPFFAFFEYALAVVMARFDPDLVHISATPILTTRVLHLQRLSVILSDTVLFYAVLSYCASWPSVTTTEAAFSRSKRFAVLLLTTLDAGLLVVDHIHFQYNGLLLGLLILSATKLREKKDLQGAFLYAVLLMMKHIYLYVAPLYFVYLLGHHCYQLVPEEEREKEEEVEEKEDKKEAPGQLTDQHTKPDQQTTETTRGEDDTAEIAMVTMRRRRSISETDVHETIQSQHDGRARFSFFHFVRLGLLVVSVFSAALGPILWHHPAPLAGLGQVFARLFPVQRGLCHAYWAPNLWALYTFLDKILAVVKLSKAVNGPSASVAAAAAANVVTARMSGGLVQEASFAVLPDIPPVLCALLTFASMAPVLYSVWKYPDSSLFMNALVYCMHCSFLWGYHVHEKAILQVLLPLALLSAESVNDMRLYRYASLASVISLFPLLFTPAEQVTKLLLAVGHALLAYVTLDPLLKDSLRRRHIRASAVGFHVLEKLSLAILITTAIVAMLLPWLVPRVHARYPFLPLMLFSVACAVTNVYIWWFLASQHYRKLAAVKSYLLPRK